MSNPFTNDDDELNMTLSKALQQAEDKSTYLENEMPDIENTEKKVAKKKVKTEVKPAAKAKKSNLPVREIPEGYIGLTSLAIELGMQPATLRRRLRTLEVTKPEGQHGWMWKENSKELKDLRKSLAS